MGDHKQLNTHSYILIILQQINIIMKQTVNKI